MNENILEKDMMDEDDLYEIFEEEVQRDLGKMFDDLQGCYKEVGLPINTVNRIGMLCFLDSLFTHDGLSVECVIHVSPIKQKIGVMMRFMTIPLEKVAVVLDYLNDINSDLYGYHFVIVAKTGQIALLAGMNMGILVFDKMFFKALLQTLLKSMREHAPHITKLAELQTQPKADQTI